MAIISFWGAKKGECGKSSAIAAIATFLGINHNYKILIIDTKYNDFFYQDCFWRENKGIKPGINNYTGVGEGISGLSRAILSNKISPEIITNYTKIVFNDNRLELLTDANVLKEEYNMHQNIFKDIAKTANRFYDLVFVDIDSDLTESAKDSLLEISDIVVACMPQNIRSINSYISSRAQKQFLQNKLVLPLIGRYDVNSKYNQKNITKYIKEKRDMLIIPYNTLFMEACNEAKLPDFFIKLKGVNSKGKSKNDDNSMFIYSILDCTDKLIYYLKEAQMRV